MEILKKNNEIKLKKLGKHYGDKERVLYETPGNVMRDTLAIDPATGKAFKDEREAFMSNFEDFLNNLDLEKDPTDVQHQVDSYIEQFKVYNQHRTGKLKALMEMKTKGDSSDSSDQDDGQYKKNMSKQSLILFPII